MLTFLELYQTLLGFVFFKLYADAGLTYPPPLDTKKDETAAGVGAFNLQEILRTTHLSPSETKTVNIDSRTISGKDVRQTIKTISAESPNADIEMLVVDTALPADPDEDFVLQPSTSDPRGTASLPTLKSLTDLPQSRLTTLFSPYVFFLSRESSRPIFEFIVRSFGGRLGWSPSSGSGSPFDESDPSITHVIIDRPLSSTPDETAEMRELKLRRKWVQPQWVVDCVNAGKILLEEAYEQGKTLPPHLSPFGETEGAYDPTLALNAQNEESEYEEEGEEEENPMVATEELPNDEKVALEAAAGIEVDDGDGLRAAGLAAEAAGVDYGTFEKVVKGTRRKAKAMDEGDREQDMNKMMMSNKQRKLYERIKHSEMKRKLEVKTPLTYFYYFRV